MTRANVVWFAFALLISGVMWAGLVALAVMAIPQTHSCRQMHHGCNSVGGTHAYPDRVHAFS